jgi:hypothetical protein
MLLSEILAWGSQKLNEEGDAEVVVGDMQPVVVDDLKIVKSSISKKQYLHIGDW